MGGSPVPTPESLPLGLALPGKLSLHGPFAISSDLPADLLDLTVLTGPGPTGPPGSSSLVVSLSDPDLFDVIATATLSATNGTLSLGSTAGLSFTSGTSNGD